MENKITKERMDLKIIGFTNPITIYSKDGLELRLMESGRQSINAPGLMDIELLLDGKKEMSTNIINHLVLEKCVKECPENSRVFLGGLAFGLILLYLAEAKKTKEVIICEIDQRVIDKFSSPITSYLKENYPDFNFKIIKGDAYDEIKKNGLFDWIFLHFTDGVKKEFIENVNLYLTPSGIFTRVNNNI